MSYTENMLQRFPDRLGRFGGQILPNNTQLHVKKNRESRNKDLLKNHELSIYYQMKN